MIIDCHTHAWDRWPYEPKVPDPETRGAIEQLLFEMDRNDVDKAVLEYRFVNNRHTGSLGQQYGERGLPVGHKTWVRGRFKRNGA